MTLYDVDFTKLAFPCLEYALSRTGCGVRGGLKALENQYYPLAGDSAIEHGDILMWVYDDRPEQAEVSLTIHEDTVVSTLVTNNFHVGVMEKDGLVSDLTERDGSMPYIRFRYLYTLPYPTRIYRKY